MGLALLHEDETRAVNEYLKGKKVNVLLGIGSWQHTGHCFSLGFPDNMVLFDPVWKKEDRMAKELDILKEFCDKDVPLKFVKTSSQADIIEFSFQGKKKTVQYYKQNYDPSILGQIKPKIFHMGHRCVEITDEQLQESLLLLPVGTIILNIVEVLQAKHAGVRAIYTNYFLDPKIPYVDAEGAEYYLAVKSREIDQDKLMIISRFADAFITLAKELSEKKYVETELLPYRKEWEELEAKVNARVKKEGGIPKEHGHLRSLRGHERQMSESLKKAEELKNVLTPAMKKRLLSLIDQLEWLKKNKPEFLQEALKISGLR